MSKIMELATLEALNSIKKVSHIDAIYSDDCPDSVVGGGHEWCLPQLMSGFSLWYSLQEPVTAEVEYTRCCLCCASGPIIVTATMDRGIYAEGMRPQSMNVSHGELVNYISRFWQWSSVCYNASLFECMKQWYPVRGGASFIFVHTECMRLHSKLWWAIDHL